ncbi:MAG TPA: SIR2 family protein, partial [Candidatus Lokiarchaeia archaeon]|nr:SIR2 family protein [Candidatus Lokiarchaeia archaeon]
MAIELSKLSFENFANMLDMRLYEVFKVLDLSEPNGTHQLIAKLAKTGKLKACITTNFDVFIERALEAEGVDYDLLVDNRDYDRYNQATNRLSGETRREGVGKFILCKIHGTISKPESIVSVASAYKSSKGFSLPKAELITFLLTRYSVLFLGYSGWDFEHLNYRRFWERVGHECKGIHWNRRPGETSGPKFHEIFQTALDRFQFCEGELPEDLLAGINEAKLLEVDTTQLSIYDRDTSETQFSYLKAKRSDFLRTWAIEIPESLAYGLVLSEANQFSQQYKETVKNLHKQSEDSDVISYGSANIIQELSQKLSTNEITMEEYQVQVQNYMFQIRLGLIKKSYRPQVIEWMQNNAFPGITDNPNQRDIWLGFLGPFSINFDIEEANQQSQMTMMRYSQVIGKTDLESQAEAMIVGCLPSIMHPKKTLWEPYYEQMQEQKARFLNDKLSYEDFTKKIQDLTQQCTNARLGITIPIKTLYEGLITVVGNSASEQDFELGCEALFLCMDAVGGYMFSDLLKEPETMKSYSDITSSISENNAVEESLI